MWCTAVAGIGAQSGPVSPGHACGKLERTAETRELVGFHWEFTWPNQNVTKGGKRCFCVSTVWSLGIVCGGSIVE